MNTSNACFLCGSDGTTDFFELPPMPTMDGVMSSTYQDALAVAIGMITLRFCPSCGYIGNETYDVDKVIFDDYDFSNDYSPLFRQYVHSLCQQLIDKHKLYGKSILDVGCGDGYFLELLCTMGNNKGIGIDSGFDLSKRTQESDTETTYIQSYYTDTHKDLHADLVTCRLVIDLLDDPVAFLNTFRRNLDNQPNTVVFFEVPNATYTFEERVIWNVAYEHRSWFTPESLTYLFEKCGFELLDIFPLWNDEFLGIEAKIRSPFSNDITSNKYDNNSLSTTVAGFNQSYLNLLETSKTRIANLEKEDTRVIGWGAGARSITFFNLFDIRDLVPYVIDINVNRQGKFIRGSGQKIVPPTFIAEYNPDLVIVTNPTYAEEIKMHVRELGVLPEFWVL